jgi:8-oxo-dGTP pyrophosphatase MutT (NUDIX family)
VEAGEDELTAGIRETEEEAGLTQAMLQIDDKFQQTISYCCNGDVKQPKTVAWWLARLVDDNARVILSDEHEAFEWLSLDEAIAIAAYDEMAVLLRSAEQFLRRGDRNLCV